MAPAPASTPAAPSAQQQHQTFQLKEATYSAFGPLGNRAPAVFATSVAVRRCRVCVRVRA